MVNAQRHLIDHLGIEKLLSVAGGSMGGMQVLQWVASYPERVRSAIPIATALKHSPQQIAFNEVVRQSIMADPDWRQGNYYEYGQPDKGLAVARMIGHITFMSDQSMEEKFSRRLKNGDYSFKFGADFEVEGYLRYRGDTFVKRFDANSYLYITKAIDYFDLSDGKLVSREKPIDTRFLVISFKSDWLYPCYQSQEIVRQLKAGFIDATYCEIASTYGHDAFLVEVEEQTHLIRHFLEKTYLWKRHAGIWNHKDARLDHRIIFDLIEPGSKVLDLGCGNGDLMYILTREKNARAQGIEVDDTAIYECVKKGLSVFHSDIERGLVEYPDRSFDYVILNQSMQEVKKVDFRHRGIASRGGENHSRLSQLRLHQIAAHALFPGALPDHALAALPLVRYAQRPLPEHQRFHGLQPGETSQGPRGPIPG